MALITRRSSSEDCQALDKHIKQGVCETRMACFIMRRGASLDSDTGFRIDTKTFLDLQTESLSNYPAIGLPRAPKTGFEINIGFLDVPFAASINRLRRGQCLFEEKRQR